MRSKERRIGEMAYFISLLLLAFSLNAVALAKDGGDIGDTAPEFPSGKFSDGRQYHLSDFRGKILVLFFYEQRCPTCRSTIPARNSIVEHYAGRVQFIGVGAGDSVEDVSAYVSQTRLAMPVFADSHSKMERAYGIDISLNNIYQVRVIGPDGQVVGYDMEPETIDQALGQLSSTNGNPNSFGANQMPSPTNDYGSAANLGGAASQTWAAPPPSTPKATPVSVNDEAVNALNNGNYKEAIEKLKALLQVEPSYKVAQNNLGIAYTDYGLQLAHEGKLVEAEAVMKQALKMAQQMYSPNDPRVSNRRKFYADIVHQLGQQGPGSGQH